MPRRPSCPAEAPLRAAISESPHSLKKPGRYASVVADAFSGPGSGRTKHAPAGHCPGLSRSSCEWSFAYWIELSPRQVHGTVSPKALGARWIRAIKLDGGWIIPNSINGALRDQVDDAPLRVRAALDVGPDAQQNDDTVPEWVTRRSAPWPPT